MANCTFVKRSGNVCARKSSGVRCETHKGKRNKLPKRRKTGRKIAHTPSAIRFYDVSQGRVVLVPRENCKIRRSQGRGGDQVYTVVNGRKLFTFVTRGFQL